MGVIYLHDSFTEYMVQHAWGLAWVTRKARDLCPSAVKCNLYAETAAFGASPHCARAGVAGFKDPLYTLRVQICAAGHWDPLHYARANMCSWTLGSIALRARKYVQLDTGIHCPARANICAAGHWDPLHYARANMCSWTLGSIALRARRGNFAPEAGSRAAPATGATCCTQR